MNARFLQTLSLCMRAGVICFGLDTVRAAAREGRVQLLLTACDLSPKTLKEAAFTARTASLPIFPLPLTMEQIRIIIGRKTGVIAVTDPGLARRLCELMEEPAQDSSQP